MRIAVCGATGYQAGLVLTELTRRGLEPVLVGRDPDRLAAVAPAAAPRRVADLADPGVLAAAFAGCAAVVNCAGPFTPTGPAVARAAIAAGCHYVDTAGEQLFVKALFDTLGERAARAGVALVPAANDGALPADLLAHLVAARVAPVAGIAVTHLISGGAGMSRGSLRSFDAWPRNSPWGPATKLEPQNCKPRPPSGAASVPIRLHASRGTPLATAWPRCTVIHASRWRSFSACASAGSQPIAVG